MLLILAEPALLRRWMDLISLQDPGSDATVYLLGFFTLRVLALIPILLVLAYSPHAELRRTLILPKRSTAIGYAGIVVFASVVLNSLGVWKFIWRYEGNVAFPIANQLVETSQIAGMVLWGLTVIVIIPIIEEIVFRFGLLQLVLRNTHSQVAAVIVSSIVFGILHIGAFPPNSPQLINAIWLFAGSAWLARIALQRKGGLCLCILVHATRNAVEFSLLYPAVMWTHKV